VVGRRRRPGRRRTDLEQIAGAASVRQVSNRTIPWQVRRLLHPPGEVVTALADMSDTVAPDRPARLREIRQLLTARGYGGPRVITGSRLPSVVAGSDALVRLTIDEARASREDDGWSGHVVWESSDGKDVVVCLEGELWRWLQFVAWGPQAAPTLVAITLLGR